MTNQGKPLAITMGDPSGIGPEIIVKALVAQPDARAVVFGCPKVMKRAIDTIGTDHTVRPLQCVREARFALGVIEVLRAGNLTDLPPFGQICADSGQAAIDAIQRAIASALDGQMSGIVAAPIHKEALSQAGIKYPGHTEMLADFGGAERVAMLLGNDEIRTVLVTIHCSLSDAIKGGNFEAQMAAIRLAHEGATALGYDGAARGSCRP
ncbi:4-hydroxythreonine-4-phosphate dehydrogenase PdxA [uncultured Ruegeria sp.]|uniref:4-hydroxythreonine-4-phosphate dehydrogenase PdxA n=1 Tax=uncultured Ruegeria sp. TaxID=259304 RepID=UPI002612418A|nr:4-hydroxythreonine-4-phosphate dehydrogenase PdxA [uncultured Ruegeria sp.]